MNTIIGIQEEYIRTVNDGAARWAHRKCGWDASRPGGHFNRICRGAHTKAFKSLKGLGFSDESAEQIIADAAEMARLEAIAEE